VSRRPRRFAVVLVLLALLLGGLPVAAPPAEAASLYGHDVSWPQCPTSLGGFGLPMPPSSTAFAIIGLTRGLPFTENPCLQSQVDWQEANNKRAHGYVVAAFPTPAQLSTYGTQGPWSAGTRAGRLSNVGYAAARFALASYTRVGFTAPVIWIDVEPRPAQPWPTGTAAQRRENRLVLEGTMRALRDAGFGYGLYSYQAGWADITDSWWLPGLPVWATAGRLDYATEAEDRCVQPSFSGGRVYISQWYDDTRDYDLTCGTYGFTPLGAPPSTLGNSTADWNGDWNNDLLARVPSTGELRMYRGTGQGPIAPGGVPIGSGWNIFDAIDTVGDLNGDGTLDVLARETSTGALWLYPGDGSGGWRPWTRIGSGWNVMSTIVGPGDFTGDQRADVLAVEGATGTLWLYPGNGVGGFLPRVRAGDGWYVMSTAFSTGDFDGDGNADLLAREIATGYLWLYRGNGAGGWLPRVRVGDGWNVMSALIGAGDFTGDRAADVLAREGSTGYLWLYPGNGTGGWLSRVRIDSGWTALDPIF
jgi:FG-GAP-like repeat